MVIFNSYVSLPEGMFCVDKQRLPWGKLLHSVEARKIQEEDPSENDLQMMIFAGVR